MSTLASEPSELVPVVFSGPECWLVECARPRIGDSYLCAVHGGLEEIASRDQHVTSKVTSE